MLYMAGDCYIPEMSERLPSGPRIVAVSGTGGLVGSALCAGLREAGHAVRRLVRGRPRADDEFGWDPATGEIDPAAFAGAAAVVHLAGESIAAGRWSAARKERIRHSRVAGTTGIAAALAALPPPAPALVAASAIGFYGDRGDEALDESSPAGNGFLAEVCRAWEAATEPAERAGVRVVRVRIGVVLAAAGGALPRMLPPFRLGLGGRIGDGRQYMSWIALDDLVAVLRRAALDASLAGAVNAVAPGAVRNAEFARVLARVLRRPAWLPLPAPLVRLLLGEMGRELLLAGARVLPQRLAAAGFDFRHPALEPALRSILSRPG